MLLYCSYSGLGKYQPPFPPIPPTQHTHTHYFVLRTGTEMVLIGIHVMNIQKEPHNIEVGENSI